MSDQSAQNIFVLGLDELNLSSLRALPRASSYHFHQLLTIDEMQRGNVIDLPDLLERARRQLKAFEGPIDAIVGYWDFPISTMVPILAKEFGTRSAPLEAVLKCEHKYWSRLEQQKVIDEYPRFAVVNPDDDVTTIPDGVSYPVWVKPVKSTSSEAAYYVDSDAAFQEALRRERSEVHRMGDPFSWAMSMADVPPEVADVGGTACIVEEAATGDQVTVEGYVQDDHIEIYGIIDSIRHPDASSFVRYQYPSALPLDVTTWMSTVARHIIRSIGLNHSTFNIEFFWDAERRTLMLLEINPRHSQSHARMFQLVDGLPNHAIMIDLATGVEPDLPHGDGPYDIAGKWFLRRFTDAVVRRVPTPSEIASIQQDIPGTLIDVLVEPGVQLSDLVGEDSYSFILANAYIGARDEDELVHKYAQCVEALRFEFDE